MILLLSPIECRVMASLWGEQTLRSLCDVADVDGTIVAVSALLFPSTS